MRHIFKCKSCNKYTMEETCCGEKTVESKPAKYSPQDKYAKYRRIYKENEKE